MTTNTHDARVRLEALYSQLTEELRGLGIHDPESDDWEATALASTETDESLVADASEDADEHIAILAELETRYRNVVRALAKIDQGTYGICEMSGEVIEADRLEANPAARTCKGHMNDEMDLPL
jgi:RNA polymerase-binding transcription factor DksA